MSRETGSSETFLPSEAIHSEILQAVAYLRDMQQEYGNAVAQLREKYGIRNRACGPSSFSLAVLLQEYFQKQGISLPIEAAIVEPQKRVNGITIMFGAEKEGFDWIDHAWLEIVFNGQVLIVSHESDPSSAQSSYRAAAAEPKHMQAFYDTIGFHLAENLEELQARAGLSAEVMSDVVQLIKTINKGAIPENYAEYVQLLLSQLRETTAD